MFKRLLNLKLKQKVLFSFVLIMTMLVLLGVRFYFTIQRLESNKQEILRSSQVSNVILNVKFSMAYDLKLLMEIANSGSSSETEKLWEQHQKSIKRFDDSMVNLFVVLTDTSWGEGHAALKKQFLDMASNVQTFREKQLVPTIKQVYQLKTQNFTPDSLGVLSNNQAEINKYNNEITLSVEPILALLSDFENKGYKFVSLVELSSQGVAQQARTECLILVIVGVLLSLLLAFLLTNYLVGLINKLNKAVKLLSEGKLSDNIINKSTDELGEMVSSFNDLTLGLKNTSEFANEIGAGNFDMDFKPLSKEDVLGNALLEMRTNLLSVAESEKKRSWSTEGMALFGEILRNNNENFDILATNIINNLVKYLDANQGGLFVVNDSNPKDKYLDLVACYAWDKKRFVEMERVNYGAGVIGQAWKDAEFVYMTDVPRDFVAITSGLGDANPSSVLVVPLTVNEVTYGMIEIASFHLFEKYQLEFIEKLAESIASTLAGTKTNENTKLLLDASQKQTEQMKLQEEAMRQNMEEMQATQEEMERKEIEMRDMVQKMQQQEEELLQTLEEVKATSDEMGKANLKMAELMHEVNVRDDVFGLTTILSESDMFGNVTFANQKLVEVSKYSMEEIIGKPHSLFRHPDMPKELFKLMWDTLKSGKVFKGVVKNKTKEGNPYWIDGCFVPIKDQNGNIFKYIGARYHIVDEVFAQKMYDEQMKKIGF
jgi:PAS domain S-box-containing protein